MLSSCVCRALVDSWRETSWPSAGSLNFIGVAANGLNGSSVFPACPDPELDLADALAADLDGDGPAHPEPETDTSIGPSLPPAKVLGPAAVAARSAAESEFSPVTVGHPMAATATGHISAAEMRLIAAAAKTDMSSSCVPSQEHSARLGCGSNPSAQSYHVSAARRGEIVEPQQKAGLAPLTPTSMSGTSLPPADVRRRSLFASANLDEEFLNRVRVAQTAAESVSASGCEVGGSKAAPGTGRELAIFKRSGPAGDRSRKGVEDDTNDNSLTPASTIAAPVPAAKKRRVITAGQSDSESDSAD